MPVLASLKRLVVLLGVFCLAGFQQAHATVNSVTSTPSPIVLQVQGSNSVSVIWRVNRTNANSTGSPTTTEIVSSNSATLIIGGSVVETLAGTISQASTTLPGAVTTVIFQETLTFNAAVVRQILNAAPGTVVVQRLFSDTQGGPVTAQAAVTPGAGNAGPLSVTRVDLKFENNSRTAIARKGDVLRAVAELNFRSSGLLNAEWRIVDPTASQGSARGRILEVVRRPLVSSGQGRNRIFSPPLPTSRNGLYLLTFFVETEDASVELPILRYVVLEGSRGEVTRDIETFTPTAEALITPDTVFNWEAVEDAAVYRISLFRDGEKNRISAREVTGQQIRMSLQDFSLEGLVSGQRYEWVLSAYDRNGNLIGASPRTGFFVR
ncbi:hypothetical protein [Kiloniella sp. b19]|uniref:hypothetical protein n=1 Tax=Kiloniella sp. GXU_MW_B19 TaxID=3141326 RepID=UPI0031D975AB